MKKSLKKALIMMLSIAMVFTCISMPVYADAATLDEVLAEIGELGNDPRDFTAEDKAAVEAIWADYEALSAEDKATVDSTFNHPSGDGQSYGRVLEAALWAVRSFDTDTSTTLADGTYTTSTEPAVSSESDKGKSDSSRKRNWWVESVVVENGQATAYIYVTSGAATASKLTSYPSVWIGGQTINRDSDNNYPIPVDLNGLTYFGGISSSMPRPIMYTLSTTIAEPEPVQSIELTIVNNTGMFKAVTASAVENADGSATLTMALSGTGYHNLYKGTYEQAVANGANMDNWIAGTLNADGKLEFVIPITADELGKEVPVVAVSQSYYEKYQNGENTIDRAFYPRQLNLDLEAAKLTTDDYKSTKEIAVTNNIKMFKPGETAELECVGGPNSNNYKADLVLPMQSDSMSAVFVGDYAEAAAAAEPIAFDSEDMTFTIPVKWVETFGQPETLVNLANGEPFHICFKSAKNGTWYERKATLDEDAGTLVFDPSDADYTAVTAAQAAAEAVDRDKYTEESLAALDEAVDAVVTGKFESQQVEVDAMAKAINDAIAALEEKETETAEVVRIFGLNRYQTSLKVADELLSLNSAEKFDTVILASGRDYPDALAGSYLSCVRNCPILLVDGDKARIDAAQAYIKEKLADGGTVYLLGGDAVVPNTAAAGLEGYNVVRLGGANRYLTDIKILEEALKFDTEASEILVSTGKDFADSLSAASVGKPILLVGTALTNDQKEFLDKLEGEHTFTAIGGTGAVSEAVMKELEAYGKTDRVGGKNRYETSVEVAKKYFKSSDYGVLAYARDFPDGLCGGALAHKLNAPLVITDDSAISIAAAFAKEQGVKYGAVLGGTPLISDASVKTFFNMDENDEIIVR